MKAKLFHSNGSRVISSFDLPICHSQQAGSGASVASMIISPLIFDVPGGSAECGLRQPLQRSREHYNLLTFTLSEFSQIEIRAIISTKEQQGDRSSFYCR